MKLNEKFRPLWDDDTSDYFVITGGRGSGKSFGVSDFLENLMFEKGHKALFTRYTMASAHLSIIPEFNEKIELEGHAENFKVNKASIRNHNGSTIMFRGIMTTNGNQTARLKGITGLSEFILDEAEELVDERTFDTIDESVRQKGVRNRSIIIMNPSTKLHWVYKRFFEAAGVPEDFNGVKDGVRYIHTSYLDNLENLSDKFINRAARVKEQNYEKWRHIYMGDWAERAEGVIYTNWKLQSFRDDLVFGYGLDFGFAVHPDALVQVAIDKKRERIYLKQHIYETGLNTNDLGDKIKKRISQNNIIYADNSEPRLISELKATGLRVRPAHKPPGSVSAGIKIMQDYLLCIDPDSLDLIKELNYYRWKEKGEIPIKEWDHLLDAARYYVMTQLTTRGKTKSY